MSWRNIYFWQKPSAEVMAREELEHAKRELLEAQTNSEYYSKLVLFNKERIQRLAVIVRQGEAK